METIRTWEERHAGWETETPKDAMLAEIADLRAELARADEHCEEVKRLQHEQACRVTHALMAERDEARAALAKQAEAAPVGADEGMAFEIWAKENIAYASTVSAWAAWLARAEIAKSAVRGEVIYQVSLAGDTWMDTDQDHYEGYSSVHRRTLYTAPPPQPDSGRDAVSEAAPVVSGDDLEAALDAEYPIPDSPHASVTARAHNNRCAFERGWYAALDALDAAMAAQQGEKGGAAPEPIQHHPV